jgi:hypothetical protein
MFIFLRSGPTPSTQSTASVEQPVRAIRRATLLAEAMPALPLMASCLYLVVPLSFFLRRRPDFGAFGGAFGPPKRLKGL